MSHNHPLAQYLIVVSLNISLYPYTSVLYRLFLHSLPYGIYRRGLFNISSLYLCRFCVCVLIYAKVLIIPNVVAPLYTKNDKPSWNHPDSLDHLFNSIFSKVLDKSYSFPCISANLGYLVTISNARMLRERPNSQQQQQLLQHLLHKTNSFNKD